MLLGLFSYEIVGNVVVVGWSRIISVNCFDVWPIVFCAEQIISPAWFFLYQSKGYIYDYHLDSFFSFICFRTYSSWSTYRFPNESTIAVPVAL